MVFRSHGELGFPTSQRTNDMSTQILSHTFYYFQRKGVGVGGRKVQGETTFLKGNQQAAWGSNESKYSKLKKQ